MALVLQRQLTPKATVLVGECPKMNSRLQIVQVRSRGGAQHQIRSNATAVLLQQNVSGSGSSSPIQEASCEKDVLSSAKVFEDTAHGICCYRSPTGEVTCEGHDEGPHFEPAECCPERTTETKSWICDSSPIQEVLAYKYVTGGQGKCWCEGKDES
ncbi:unnamed protein product [Calypogeia fissa]